MKFSLEIDLGNEAMQSKDDVAIAVKDVASRIIANQYSDGPVLDRNGNVVGSYTFYTEDA